MDQSAPPPTQTPPPLPGAAPPTSPGALLTRPQAEGWSTPLGVVMIVFAALAFLGSLGRVSNAVFLGSVPMPNAAGGLSTFDNPMQGVQIAAALLLMTAACLGLAAGIGLAAKKRWALSLALLWAGGKIVVLVPAIVVDVIAQTSMFDAMMSQPGAAPLPGALGAGMAAFTALFTAVTAGGLPLFVLGFGLRRKARAAWDARFAGQLEGTEPEHDT